MDIKKISTARLLQIYEHLLVPRNIEEKMLLLLRQNRISKWFSGIGQEAISVGTCLAVQDGDYILPMHRNLGVFTTRKMPLYELFCQLLGKADGFTKGRDRSFHFGSLEYNIVGMISHLAAMLPVADGLALAGKLRDENRIAIAFTGDGATSEGDFHEAINLAAVWGLPVIFLVENNGYGLSTPTSEQFKCDSLSDRAIGYGIHGETIDGNDVIAVMETISEARVRALDGIPTLIEAKTFRMRGHEEASGTAYIPKYVFEEWALKDPILQFRRRLLEDRRVTKKAIAEVEERSKTSFLADLERALNAPTPSASIEEVEKRVFAPSLDLRPRTHQEKAEMRFIDAIQKALYYYMEEHQESVILGQDIAEYGGVFKVTQGFIERFGKTRVRNTPIIESGALGAALGMAYAGIPSIVEMQFSDFISCGFNQIVNNIAKTHYRWSPPVNITIRAPFGAGVGAGPFHSQSPENWFMPVAGLKVLVPATVQDALDLTYSALCDPNPVLIFEHKKLYRSLKESIYTEPALVDLQTASVVRRGSQFSIVAYGQSVQWALSFAEKYPEYDPEIIDLRCLSKIDIQTVGRSLKKTGRVLLFQEASATMGPMSEVSSLIGQHYFEFLDAPIKLCASLDTPIPFHPELEREYLADSRLKQTVEELINY